MKNIIHIVPEIKKFGSFIHPQTNGETMKNVAAAKKKSFKIGIGLILFFKLSKVCELSLILFW